MSANKYRRLGTHLALCANVSVAIAAQTNDCFLNLPLEDLLQIEISSASRKAQPVQEVAAAVFVISHEDIERSGARSIPEALRLAPGVEVARMANNRWAVSIRGFNGRFANKLLVLKDGRSIYSPLFAGVLWEAEDAILSDIERIEVIRGPSATLWGTNAVNGVVNIISRHAAETQGTELIASTATDEAGAFTLRHGFPVGDGHLRLSVKGFDQASSQAANGVQANDHWQAARLGLRADWPSPSGGRWMLVGETYDSTSGDRLDRSNFGVAPALLDIDQRNRGGNLSLRHEQPLADGSQLDWQVSVDTSRLHLDTLIHEERDTVSAEFQRRTPRDAHELLWGGSYRFSRDRIDLPGTLLLDGTAFDRPQRDWEIASVFVHGEYQLRAQTLRVSGGLRLDHDNWSGTQAQPDLRLAWTPSPDTTWWTSLARAARTPSRAELDMPLVLGETPANAPSPAVRYVRFPLADGALKAEIVDSLEAGFRQRVNAQLSVDIAAFVSDYTGLSSLVLGSPQAVSPTLVVVPLGNTNAASARTHGFEIAADWQVTPRWRIQPHYARLYLSNPRLSDPALSVLQDQWDGLAPMDRVSLRSSWNWGKGHQFDVWLKYTSSMSNPAVPAYTALDLRYAWRISKQADVALVGQNLLGPRHLEFVPDTLPMQRTEVGRSLMIKGAWRF